MLGIGDNVDPFVRDQAGRVIALARLIVPRLVRYALAKVTSNGGRLDVEFWEAKRTCEAVRADTTPRFHDLRHTAAMLLLGRGVNPKIVSEMLGHASIAITLDIYSHVLPDMQQDAATTLERTLFG